MQIPAMESAKSAPAQAFIPTHFVDVTTTVAAKRHALEAYAQEMREFPHARSFEAVDALMRMRGSTVGLGAAEAFAVLRQIQD